MTMGATETAKIRYMAEQIRKGLQEAISEQKKRANVKLKNGFRAERLMEALDNVTYTVNEGQLGVQAIMQVPLYVRFADIKRLGNAKVYDKPVWGQMYDRTLQDIKYEYRDWLRRTYGDSLRQN